jgi:hypothetical protein
VYQSNVEGAVFTICVKYPLPSAALSLSFSLAPSNETLVIILGAAVIRHADHRMTSGTVVANRLAWR